MRHGKLALLSSQFFYVLQKDTHSLISESVSLSYVELKNWRR